MTLMERLSGMADLASDGHVTIMKFTTNWRVGFGTPNTRCDICLMFEGKTFEEAAEKAIAYGHRVDVDWDVCACHEEATASENRERYTFNDLLMDNPEAVRIAIENAELFEDDGK